MDIFLGQNKLGWCDAGKARWEAHDQSQGRLMELFAEVRGEAKRRFLPSPGKAARLWLSGAVARPFILQQPVGVQRDRDRLVMAQARAAEATGLSGPCALRLERKLLGGQVELVVAMEANLATQIEAAAKGARLSIKSIRPWWAGVLERVLAKQTGLELFSARDTDSLIVLLGSGGDWVSADAYLPPPSQPETDLLMLRKLLVAGVDSANTWAASLNQGASAELPNALTGIWPTSRQTLNDAVL